MDAEGSVLAFAGGNALAFATAAAAVFFDCYTSLAKSLPRVPGSIITHPAMLALCAVCGVIAAGAYSLTDPNGSDVVSTILTLQAKNPLLRGIAVGAMVLVIIRSKLFNTQDSGFGGEAVYTLLRSLAIQAVNDSRTKQRNRFLNLNIGAAFAIPTYFDELEDQIKASIAARSPEYRTRVEEEMAAVKSQRPPPPMTKDDPAWNVYYRAFTGICFDYCGPKILSEFPGFRMR
jgi:hypothetical protein